MSTHMHTLEHWFTCQNCDDPQPHAANPITNDLTYVTFECQNCLNHIRYEISLPFDHPTNYTKILTERGETKHFTCPDCNTTGKIMGGLEAYRKDGVWNGLLTIWCYSCDYTHRFTINQTNETATIDKDDLSDKTKYNEDTKGIVYTTR